MKTFLAAGALAAVLALPAATAALSTGDQYAAFEGLADVVAPGAADLRALPVVYLDEQGDAWQESNGLAGLQTGPTDNDQGDRTPADTHLGGWSTVVASLPDL